MYARVLNSNDFCCKLLDIRDEEATVYEREEVDEAVEEVDVSRFNELYSDIRPSPAEQERTSLLTFDSIQKVLNFVCKCLSYSSRLHAARRLCLALLDIAAFSLGWQEADRPYRLGETHALLRSCPPSGFSIHRSEVGWSSSEKTEPRIEPQCSLLPLGLQRLCSGMLASTLKIFQSAAARMITLKFYNQHMS